MQKKKKNDSVPNPLGLDDWDDKNWDNGSEFLPPLSPGMQAVKGGLDEIKSRAAGLQRDLMGRREKLIDELEEVMTLKKEIFDTVGVLREYHLSLTKKERFLKMVISGMEKKT